MRISKTVEKSVLIALLLSMVLIFFLFNVNLFILLNPIAI